MELSAVLTPAPEGGYVPFNLETGTTSQGETVEEALANLTEATGLYLEEFLVATVSCSMLTISKFLKMFKLSVVSKGK
ncbi:MAG: type II toxin-antitoxin system HicB family antitoxin [Nitrosomonas sp.]|nr:type II toxin-antitoxin system HicB family antitoxin [Nitrosomonas sp.]OQW84463.1 MAG: HicB family protein [Proteobacteria bacterium ST_bin16]TXI42488.1 MAG: type II toxin-antitoxin system HicB family antitoxin [Nitrosomonas sp.]